MNLESGNSAHGGSMGNVQGGLDWAMPEKRMLAGRSSN
jgi:hypothetical protein